MAHQTSSMIRARVGIGSRENRDRVSASMVNIVNKSLHLAARDYEKRWGCAPHFPEQESHVYLAWEMPKAKLARWMNSMAN